MIAILSKNTERTYIPFRVLLRKIYWANDAPKKLFSAGTIIMKRHLITKFHQQFERLLHRDGQSGSDIWLARELQQALGYTRWANFARVIHKAESACKAAGHDPDQHFLEIAKLVSLNNPAAHETEDIALTRYASYLVAQAADESKAAVAFARSYFLEPSRNEELVERRIADAERLQLRDELTRSEKLLAGLIYEHVADEEGLSRIHIKGDRALFGGVTTRQMKHRLQVPKGRALADFLPAIAIKAKDFATELTNAAVKRDYLHTEAQITREHVKNNREVRKFLSRRKIVPEKLLAAEDIKKTERRFAAAEKELTEKKLAELVPQLSLPGSNRVSQLVLALN
jgi:DNA-damage-inducible protein D